MGYSVVGKLVGTLQNGSLARKMRLASHVCVDIGFISPYIILAHTS